MTSQQIIADLKKGKHKPVYWLEGEEEFFIDQVIEFAEHHLLSESEAGFNLTVFYGRDAAWPDVVNACMRYPMFAEKQVVILKEGQAMRDIEKLESYVEKPLNSTLFFVAYKDKKVDGRTRLAKLLKERAVLFTSKKIYDNALPEWTSELVHSKGYTITKKALFLLIDHIGNDLSRISNEIDKLALNLGEKKNITEDDIERFIGVSKDFNVFELQQAIAQRDLYKAIRIVQYFAANPKAAPVQLIFPSLYNFFSKVLMVYSVADERSAASALGVNPYFVKDFMNASRRFRPQEIEKILLLLHRYNLRSIGIGDPGTDDAELLKEMVVKMIGS